MNSISLTLPLPNSVNRQWRAGRKRSFVSKEARAFKASAASAIAAMREGGELPAEPLTGPIALRATVFMKQAGADADNRLKAAQDALAEGGIIENDSHICRASIERRKSADDPRIEITLTLIPDTDPDYAALMEAMPVKAQRAAKKSPGRPRSAGRPPMV